MEVLIVLVFLAVPVIAMFMGKKRVDVKYEPLSPEVKDVESEQKRVFKEVPKKPASKPVQPAVAAEDGPREEKPFTLTDEEKKKLIIYSEILKPKYEE